MKQIRVWIRPNGVQPLPPAVQRSDELTARELDEALQSAAQPVVCDDHASGVGGAAADNASHLARNHKHRSSHWKAAKKLKKAAAAAVAAAESGESAAAAPASLNTSAASRRQPSRFQCGYIPFALLLLVSSAARRLHNRPSLPHAPFAA